ncbi:MAG: hypothetical protein AAFW97_14535 [Pseudomonadota bacterium]
MTIYQLAPVSDENYSRFSTSYASTQTGGLNSGSSTDTSFRVGDSFVSPNYLGSGGFWEFDTSGVPVGTPDQIALSLVASDTTNSSGSDNELEFRENTGANVWQEAADLSGLTLFGEITGGISSTGRKDIVCGLSDISRTSSYNIIGHSSGRRLGNAPLALEQCNTFYASEQSGTSDDPYLEIDLPSAGRAFGFIM